MITRGDVAKRYREGEPVAKVLMPYSIDDDGSNVIYLSDLSVGLAWEVTPRAISALSGDQRDMIARKIASALSRVPDYTTIQVIAVPTALIDDDLENYRRNGGSSQPMLAKLEEQKIEFYRAGRNGLGIPIPDVGFRCKKVKIIVTLAVSAEDAVAGANTAVSDALEQVGEEALDGEFRLPELPAHKRLADGLRKLKKSLLLTGTSIETMLTGSNFQVRRMDAERFIRMSRSMVHMRSGPYEPLVYDECEPLHHQIATKDILVDQDEGFVFSDGVYHKVLTISQHPPETYTGILSEPCEALRWLSLLDYVTDGIVCVNIYAKPREMINAELEARMILANRGMGHPLVRDQIKSDVSLVQAWTLTEQRRMFEVTVSMSMAHEDKKVALQRIEMLQTKLGELRFRARIEESAAPALWFQQLPFGYKPSMEEARRSKKLVDLNVADLLPIYLMDRGTTNAVYMAFNRLGEPFAWNPFDSNTGYHTFIAGASGSGKSFLINSFSLDFLRRDDRQIFIVDKGRSYAQLVGLLGKDGQFCNITLKEKTCINAFAGTYGEASPFLLDWLPFLAAQRDDDKLTQKVIGKLSDCLRRAYELKQRPNAVDPTPIGYRTKAELEQRHPGVWIHRMRKRLLADFEDDAVVQAINAVKNDEATREPAFEIYFRLNLRGRGQARAARLADFRDEDRAWLRNRVPFLDEDGDGPYALVGSLGMRQTLESAGFAIQLDQRHLVVEAAEREDVDLLRKNGLRLRIGAEFLAQHRREVVAAMRRELDGRAIDVAEFDEWVDDRVAKADPGDYFDWLEGDAVMQGEVMFSDVADVLLSSGDEDMLDLAQRLAPFYGKGPNAGFFDGKTAFDLSAKRIICWECGELFSAGKQLIGGILGAIFQMINVYAQSSAGGKREKAVIIDEFGEFMVSPVVASFTDRTLRQGRKHRLAMTVATQRVSDLAEGEARRLLEMFQFTIIGMQPPTVVARLPELLGFSPEQQVQAASVITAKGLFSEFLLVYNGMGISEVMRNIAPPMLYWCFTSDGADKALRDEKRKHYQLQGYDSQEALVKALVDCSREFPNGVAFAKRVRV